MGAILGIRLSDRRRASLLFDEQLKNDVARVLKGEPQSRILRRSLERDQLVVFVPLPQLGHKPPVDPQEQL